MKLFKTIFAFALALILAVSVCPTLPLAYDYSENQFEGVLYEVTDDGVIITGYDETLHDHVTIPHMVEDKPVIEIADFAFSEAEMFSIHFPIEAKLGRGVFYKCKKLIGIYMTDGSGESDYADQKLTLDDGKTLYFCSSVIPQNLIMEYVENIEFAAAMYLDCKLVAFPSVKTIGEEAFSESQVDTFSFENAEEIGKSAFSGSRFFDCYFGSVKKIGEKAFENAKGSLYFYCDAPEIAQDAFQNADVKIYYAKGTSGWDETCPDAKEFTPRTHTVNFCAWYTEKDEAEAPFHTVEIKEGFTLQPSDIPEAPEIEGYTLKSFVYDYKPVFTDTSFYARYVVVVWCHVRFIDSLTNQLITEIDAPFGTTADYPPVPEHTGYEFTGWIEEDWYNPDGPNYGHTEKQFYVQADRTYYSTYKAKRFSVDFIDSLVKYSEGVDPLETDAWISTRRVLYGNDIPEEDFPTPPEHFGYTFTGWSDDAKNIKEDRVIYALYEPNGLSIGDANTDGTINTSDAVQILKSAAGMLTLTDEQRMCADTNHDGVVNTSDAVLILKYAAGMIHEF